MLRIIVLTTALFFGDGVIAQAATISQVTMGIEDSGAANDAANKCLVVDYERSDSGSVYPDTLIITDWNLEPLNCNRFFWVMAKSYLRGTHTNQSNLVRSIMREAGQRYQNDPGFARQLDRFESRLLAGELDDDPFIRNLRARLPPTVTAESGGDEGLGTVSGVVPMRTRTTWCVDSLGNPVRVSPEVCRNTPEYELRSKVSR